jgi:5,10-methylenetetrahydrofolate reductase
MRFGPCGGVGFGGECEIDAMLPCPFVPTPTVLWDNESSAPVQPTPASEAMREKLAAGPIVAIDFPAAALSIDSLEACASVLAGHCDVVLAGDHGSARVQFPPAYRARLLVEAGLSAWMGFNNRDRNRVALEAELAALAHAGASGVHCITGDHTATGDRPDAKPVFDLDSTQTASLARSFGHLVSVGESPRTPPVDKRPMRLLQKEKAGAEVCFINHAGGARPAAEFIQASRDIGVSLGFIACLPIILDEDSAKLLRSFTTLVLPPGYVDRILAAPDPRAEGINAAVDLAMEFLDIDGMVGVDLSGGPLPGGEVGYAEAVAEINDRICASL